MHEAAGREPAGAAARGAGAAAGGLGGLDVADGRGEVDRDVRLDHADAHLGGGGLDLEHGLEQVLDDLGLALLAGLLDLLDARVGLLVGLVLGLLVSLVVLF